ncbi:FkbM family methyltransferase [uncultured Salinisphaera sp.]|uniref:FkbM family methyltransferase n=1 Tax=uncultured Salinisphaera sp. TaxID=359372 RepID=UPI0032B1592E|tara:strand:+ start:16571 stop:18073 length:1503 start_codon:yes stop_codon:yes gene_type:complete
MTGRALTCAGPRRSARDAWLVIAAVVALLGAATAGLAQMGAAGPWSAWVAPLVFAGLAAGVVAALPAHPYPRFGLANTLTTLRAGLAALLGTLIVEADIVAATPALAWLATAVAATALTLDALDGPVARRAGTTSRFGARFDMEIDALLIALLAGLLWATDKMGVWVLALGGLRYVFGATRLAVPRLAVGELPPSQRRRVVCGVQGIVLVVCLAPIVDAALATALGGAALIALTASFIADWAALWRLGAGHGLSYTARLGLWRSLIVYYGQPWRTIALRRFCDRLIAPGTLVFDIGAHVGHRSRAMARAGARVVAIEPQPMFADFLTRCVIDDRIRLDSRAVGARPGRSTLHVSARHPTVTTASRAWADQVSERPGFSHVRWPAQVTVDQTTLAALIVQYGEPAFCKIDVEGLEADILAGLDRPLDALAFECLPAARDVGLACIDRLEALADDYVYNWVIGEQHRWARASWCGAAAMRQEIQNLARDAGGIDIYARRETA